MWDPTYSSTYSFKIGLDEDGDDGWEPRSNQGSPSYSDAASGGSPLADDIDLYAESGDNTNVYIDADPDAPCDSTKMA
jgi:hypothetical protein